MNVGELKAGRETDVLVAEALGWSRIVDAGIPLWCYRRTKENRPDCSDEWLDQHPWQTSGWLASPADRKTPGYLGLAWKGLWNPSTNIVAAWELFKNRLLTCQVVGYLVEDPRERPDLIDIDEVGWAREWFCTCKGKYIPAPTAPLAICRAFLKAVEVEG
jgi:hypothetical protein